MDIEKRSTLREFQITGLFGRFSYSIPLILPARFANGITVITAPNGYGKSTLLRIMSDFAHGNYPSIAKTTFAEFKLITSDNLALRVRRQPSGDQKSQGRHELVFSLVDPESGGELIQPWVANTGRIGEDEIDDDFTTSRMSSMEMLRHIERSFPSLRRIGTGEWRDSRSGRILSRNEVLQLIDGGRGAQLLRADEPDWLRDFRNSLQILHISANRLRADIEGAGPRRHRPPDMVEIIAERVSDLIKGADKRYADEGRRLEQSFPNRIIKALRDRNSVMQDDVMNLVEDIQQREVRFQTLGLVSQGQTAAIDLKQTDSAAIVVLKTYLEDIKEKFVALENTAEKLRIFVETINSMLLFKSLKPSLDVGFRVVGNDLNETNIPLPALSSGEQHLIVLLGELVFGSSEGTLILLDEPEISFHPEWQEQFPRVLGQIVDINQCTVVMATHSPILAQENWESVIELANQVPA